MSKEINCKTYLDKSMPYIEAPRKGIITDGLSEESIYYLNQAVARTQENEYKIFDNNGLMPDSYDFFNDLLDRNILKVCDYTEYGKIYTADERFFIEYNQDGTSTVHYDSDGKSGFDRTATYKDTPIGNLKIEETFDADGDKRNEIEITRDITTHKRINTFYSREKNPDYNLWDKFLNIFGCGDSEEIIYYWTEEEQILKETEVNFGVNADDYGYDKKGGNHYEYKEHVKMTPEKIKHQYQVYYDWRYADKPEHEYEFK